MKNDFYDEINRKELAAKAVEARKAAYAPYSGFMVGAALLTQDGKVYTGCNIENAAYTPCCCAERTAFFKAVSEGERHFRAIAIAGGSKEEKAAEFTAPCGVCRQVMMEFCNPEQFSVILCNAALETKTYTLSEMFPMGFGPGDLA